jgi:methionyl-tRNA synthetase
MKTWTVVIEINDKDESFTQHQIEEYVNHLLCGALANISHRVMETIEAPYGPQKPGGVFIKEVL